MAKFICKAANAWPPWTLHSAFQSEREGIGESARRGGCWSLGCSENQTRAALRPSLYLLYCATGFGGMRFEVLPRAPFCSRAFKEDFSVVGIAAR